MPFGAGAVRVTAPKALTRVRIDLEPLAVLHARVVLDAVEDVLDLGPGARPKVLGHLLRELQQEWIGERLRPVAPISVIVDVSCRTFERLQTFSRGVGVPEGHVSTGLELESEPDPE